MTSTDRQSAGLSQQQFLREAAGRLGLSQADFARRIGAPLSTFEKWMADPQSNRFREMPSIAWSLVREVLEHEDLRSKLNRQKFDNRPLGGIR